MSGELGGTTDDDQSDGLCPACGGNCEWWQDEQNAGRRSDTRCPAMPPGWSGAGMEMMWCTPDAMAGEPLPDGMFLSAQSYVEWSEEEGDWVSSVDLHLNHGGDVTGVRSWRGGPFDSHETATIAAERAEEKMIRRVCQALHVAFVKQREDAASAMSCENFTTLFIGMFDSFGHGEYDEGWGGPDFTGVCEPWSMRPIPVIREIGFNNCLKPLNGTEEIFFIGPNVGGSRPRSTRATVEAIEEFCSYWENQIRTARLYLANGMENRTDKWTTNPHRKGTRMDQTDQTSDETWDKESVYDEKIAPLMEQIIAICKEHEMPMLATFQYAKLDADGRLCTTALLAEEWGTAKQLVAALNLIKNGFSAFTARVVTR